MTFGNAQLDGMKCVRVITQSKQVTRNRADAEEAANVAVIGLSNMQHVAKMVSNGSWLFSVCLVMSSPGHGLR